MQLASAKSLKDTWEYGSTNPLTVAVLPTLAFGAAWSGVARPVIVGVALPTVTVWPGPPQVCATDDWLFASPL